MNMETEKKNPLDSAYTVALYQYIGKNPWFTVFKMEPGTSGLHDGFCRVSDPLEIHFSPLTGEDVIREAVLSLDAQEARVRDECNQKVAAIREQKSQLLALTHQP